MKELGIDELKKAHNKALPGNLYFSEGTMDYLGIKIHTLKRSDQGYWLIYEVRTAPDVEDKRPSIHTLSFMSENDGRIREITTDSEDCVLEDFKHYETLDLHPDYFMYASDIMQLLNIVDTKSTDGVRNKLDRLISETIFSTQVKDNITSVYDGIVDITQILYEISNYGATQYTKTIVGRKNG